MRAAPSAKDGRVLVKPLSNGSVAVVLFNPDTQPAKITTSATASGEPASPCYAVRDLWAHTETTTTGDITRTVAPHDVAMLRISPACR